MRKIAAAAVTKTGRRLNNQDNFMLDGVAAPQNHNTFAYETKYDLNQPFLATLCDGMGGESSGERASFEACSELANICESLSQNMQENKELLNHTILRSNDRLCSIMRNEETGRMGSTIISVLIQNETLYYTNLGDSRIYLLRNGKLKQITKDHTEGQRMVDAGILTPEQLKTHHSRNKLNRHLGIFPEEMQIECEEYEDIKLQRGDKLLLCSDGVFGVLEDQTMVSILSEKKSVKARAEKLVDTAFSNGSKDNMTAVVIDYDNSVPVILPILAVAAALTVITATVLVVCLTHSPEFPQPSESNAESSGQSDFSTPAINPSSSAEHSEPSNFESENIDESSYSVDESSYSVDESSYSVDESGDQEPSANQESSYDASLDDPEPVSDESVHESTVSVTSVSLIPTSPFLKVGESKTLQADVNPQNATNKNVKWKSSNPEVVEVDTNGKITAIKEGIATITVTTSDGNKTATCTIEVKSDRVMVNKISIDPTNLELEIGGKDSHKLNVKFVPEDATNKNVKWETTDSSVAIVDSNGVVTAKNPGTAQITATAIDGEAFIVNEFEL